MTMLREGENVEAKELQGAYFMNEKVIMDMSADKTRTYVTLEAEVHVGGQRVGIVYVTDLCVDTGVFRWTDIGLIEEPVEEEELA